MAVVIPAPGKLAETARALLDLADHVHDVRTVSGGSAFEVPDDLADAFHAVTPSAPAPRKNRRGRTPRASEE